MESLWIIIIIILSMIGFTNSAEIIISTNATDFMVGSPAQLSCAFPHHPSYDVLMWSNSKLSTKLMWSNSKLSTKLMCRTQTNCMRESGYHLKRSGYNITLIIDEVDPKENQWECSDIQRSLSKSITLNIIATPKLNLSIKEIGSHTWEVTSSCSNPVPIISCLHGNELMKEVDIFTNKCNVSILSSLKVIFKCGHPSLVLRCSATRGSETVHQIGIPKLQLTVTHLPVCVYRFETSCIFKSNDLSFKCFLGEKQMFFRVESHDCPANFLKFYRMDIKMMTYGNTYNCTTLNGNSSYTIKKTVSCQIPYYTCGGLLINLGLLLSVFSVTVYLFTIEIPKLTNTWKFVIWYVGIIFVDLGALLFLWTSSMQFGAADFLPFFLLLFIKDVFLLLIGLYVKTHGGLFFVHPSKVFKTSTETVFYRRSRLSIPMSPQQTFKT